jgi:hypothetical protein
MVDPNPEIRGNGQRRLVEAGIQIGMYDPDLVNALEELNREFTRQFKKT